MSKVGSSILGAPQDLYISTSIQQSDLGATMTTGDGRHFRYAQAGGSALIAANLLQSPAQIANHEQLTPTAAAATIVANTGSPASVSVGTNVYPTLSVTLGGTAATVNQYAGGWAVVSVDAGSGGLLGQQVQIISHPAQTSTSGVLVLTLGDQLFNKITASAKIDLVPNPYAGLIQCPATGSLTSGPAAVAVYPTTASYFGWVQVAGVATVTNDAEATITVGTSVGPSDATAGAVEISDLVASGFAAIGIAQETGLASQAFAARLINLF